MNRHDDEFDELEDALRRALSQDAGQIEPGDRRDAILAATSHHGSRMHGLGVHHWSRWLAPVAAAASVALIAVSAWGISQTGGPVPAPAIGTTTTSPTPSTLPTPSTRPTPRTGLPTKAPDAATGSTSGTAGPLPLPLPFPSSASTRGTTPPIPRATATTTVPVVPMTSSSPVPPSTRTTTPPVPATPSTHTSTTTPTPRGSSTQPTHTSSTTPPVPSTPSTRTSSTTPPVPSTPSPRTSTTGPSSPTIMISISAPADGATVPAGSTTVATGRSCVFEGASSWQLLRKGTADPRQGSTTASSACPTTGTWRIPLGVLSPGSYTLRVYALSPADGRVATEDSVRFIVQ